MISLFWVGLNEIVPDSLLSVFDEYELEVMCPVTNTLQRVFILNLVIFFWVSFSCVSVSFSLYSAAFDVWDWKHQCYRFPKQSYCYA